MPPNHLPEPLGRDTRHTFSWKLSCVEYPHVHTRLPVEIVTRIWIHMHKKKKEKKNTDIETRTHTSATDNTNLYIIIYATF